MTIAAPMANRIKDMTGMRFGRLAVLSLADRDEQGKIRWKCLCDCGQEAVIRGADIRSGNTSSCGCFGREQRVRAATSVTRTHAMTSTPTWEAWQSMKRRCLDPKNKSFAQYGGRGIRICNRWMFFENFLADLGVRPPGKSIDRIDTNGDYEPANCRWATPTEQARNRRNNRLLTAYGVTKTLTDWSEDERCAVSSAALHKRIKAGWPHMQAISLPKHATRCGNRTPTGGRAFVWEAV